jgi:hypothetical protein
MSGKSGAESQPRALWACRANRWPRFGFWNPRPRRCCETCRGWMLNSAEPTGQARLRLSISRKIIGVKISCMASSILPPGTTMLLGRDMNESCSIDSR